MWNQRKMLSNHPSLKQVISSNLNQHWGQEFVVTYATFGGVYMKDYTS